MLFRSAVHVCGDTGSGHLAAALERPVVALFGPTDPARSCPYGQATNVIQHREACDSRCSMRHCALARPRCMDAIKMQEILSKVVQIGKMEAQR